MKAERVTPPPAPVSANIVITMTERQASVFLYVLVNKLHWQTLRDESGAEYGDVCSQFVGQLENLNVITGYPPDESGF